MAAPMCMAMLLWKNSYQLSRVTLDGRGPLDKYGVRTVLIKPDLALASLLRQAPDGKTFLRTSRPLSLSRNSRKEPVVKEADLSFGRAIGPLYFYRGSPKSDPTCN